MGIENQTLTFYNKNAEGFFRETVKADMSELYKIFLDYLHVGASILDLGCGSGRDSKYFIEQGYQVTAVDGSSAMCALASEYIGQSVLCKEFREIEGMGVYEGIWACASLLHIPREELPDVLSVLAGLLTTKGILYASFKYGDSQRVSGQRIFSDYTKDSFLRLCDEENSFLCRSCFITADVREKRKGVKWLNVILERR